MQTPSRTTELEAVNLMLSLLGETPVNSLIDPYTADVANARSVLLEKAKDVQSEGWAFNKDTDYTLVRSAASVPANQIVLAGNVISVDADTDSGVDVVVRGNRLYDRLNQTFVFDHDLQVEILWYFPFDEMPECMRRYVLILAGRALQSRWVGSEQQHMFTQAEEQRARLRLDREEGDTADVNILNSPDQAYISRRWGTQRRFRT